MTARIDGRLVKRQGEALDLLPLQLPHAELHNFQGRDAGRKHDLEFLDKQIPGLRIRLHQVQDIQQTRLEARVARLVIGQSDQYTELVEGVTDASHCFAAPSLNPLEYLPRYSAQLEMDRRAGLLAKKVREPCTEKPSSLTSQYLRKSALSEDVYCLALGNSTQVLLKPFLSFRAQTTGRHGAAEKIAF